MIRQQVTKLFIMTLDSDITVQQIKTRVISEQHITDVFKLLVNDEEPSDHTQLNSLT